MKKTSTSSEHGVGHLAIIVVIAVVAVVGAVGWWVLKNNQEKTPEQKAASALQEALENATCDYDDKDLCKFFTGWEATKYYKAVSTTTSEGKTTTTTIESEDEKIHMKIGGEMDYETITIGNTVYTKDASQNKWWKQTTDIAKTDESAGFEWKEPAASEEEAPTDKTTYKKLGKEPCGDLTCFKYQVINPENSDTTEYLWFDDKDYQLRKSSTESADSKSVTTFSYAKVSVKAPTPAEELGPNQYYVPGQGVVDVPTAGDLENYNELLEQYQ